MIGHREEENYAGYSVSSLGMHGSSRFFVNPRERKISSKRSKNAAESSWFPNVRFNSCVSIGFGLTASGGGVMVVRYGFTEKRI